MKDNLSVKNLKRRWTGTGSPFFKKILNLGLTVGAVGTAILFAPVTLATAGVVIVLPTIISTIAGYAVTAGLVAAAVAKLPVSPQEAERNNEIEELKSIDKGERG